MLKKAAFLASVLVISGICGSQLWADGEAKEAGKEEGYFKEERREEIQEMTPKMRKKQMRIRAEKICEEEGRGRADANRFRNCMRERMGDLREEIKSE